MSVQDENLRIPSNDWRAYQGVLSRRVMAFIIDYTIVALLWIPAAVVVFFLGILTFGLGFLLYPILFAGLAMLYFGMTVGGLETGFAGHEHDGSGDCPYRRPADGFSHRHRPSGDLLWIGNAILTPLVLLVGLFTDRGRLLHDLLIGTVTVRRDNY